MKPIFAYFTKPDETLETIESNVIKMLMEPKSICLDRTEFGGMRINYTIGFQKLEEGDRAGIWVDNYDTVVQDAIDANPTMLFADLLVSLV